jgi:hypothetical protein
MPVKLIIGPSKFNGILTKITLIMMGVLLQTLIFSFFLKFFDIPGIYVSLIVTAIIIFLGFKYLKTSLRKLIYGMLGTAIFFILIYALVMITIYSNFNSITN